MPHNNFNEMNTLATLIAVTAGVWGALLNFMKRDTSEKKFFHKASLFFMDMFVNIGITMLVYLGCIGYGLNDLMAVAISGFLGHQGTRSFYLIEMIIAEKTGAKQTFEEIKKERHG